MADTATLEKNIRDKAIDDFENKLKQAAKVFYEACALQAWTDTSLGLKPTEGSNFKRKAVREALDVIVSDVVKARTNEIGNAAVKAFVTKVEMLEDQINEVREIVEYGN